MQVYRIPFLMAFLLSLPNALSEDRCDLLIRNARLLDGTGNPWYPADIAVRGDRVVAVGRLSDLPAERVIDAEGLYVSPGFIDTHSHAGPGLATPRLSHGLPLLAQGVTTVFVNPDGGGEVDISSQRESLLADGLGVNVAQFVPHGGVRDAVLGMSDRVPTREEMSRMKVLVRRGMEAGAFGLSSGLFYAPGSYASSQEVTELVEVVSGFGGVYQSHIRDESDYSAGLLESVDEVIAVARQARIRAIVTHIKALGPGSWGMASAVVRRIENARNEGLEIYADQYPYEASATGLSSIFLPRWAMVGGREKLIERLEDPWLLPRIQAAMKDNLERRGGPGRIQFRRVPSDPSLEGLTLEAAARKRGLDPIQTSLQLLRTDSPGIVSFSMDPEDVEKLMTPDWVMTASDGGLVGMGEGVPHPRNYGTFPRKIRKYVLEKRVLTLEAAVRSMTSLPATVYRIPDRGTVRPGAFADLVAFDLTELTDKATYADPHQLSQGVVLLLVNGRPVIDRGHFNGTLAGRVLSRP